MSEGSNPLRMGLLGASRIANRAIIEPASALEGVEVVAVAARDKDRAAAFADQHGIAHSFGSYADLLDSHDIDLVYVATPPFNHAQLAIDALRRGKAVLVEKPFSLHASEAEDVLAVSRDVGLPVFEAMHSLHHPLASRLKAVLADPRLGGVQHIEGRFRTRIRISPDEFRWHARFGGGALLDLGIYPLAWIRFVAGEPLDVTDARAEMLGDVDGALTADLVLPGTVTARVDCSMLDGNHDASLAVRCEHGAVTIEGMVAPHRGNRVTVELASRAGWHETVDGPSSYEAQLAAVRDAMTGRRPFPLPADDFVRSMAAMDLIRARLR